MLQENLISHFEDQGFIQAEVDTYDQLGVAPTLLFENDTITKAVVVRESADNLSQSLIQRLAESKRIPGRTLEIYFAFPNKPSLGILRACKLYSVGILYLNNGIEIYAESKQVKGRKKISAIPKTQIFFASRQNLEERQEGAKLVDDYRESLRTPLFPMLVENDQQYSNDIRKLWPVIIRCMDDCDYVMVILSGEFRNVIDRETKRALELYEPEEILFYVKNDKETKEAWKDLMEFATLNGVKYTEYFDTRDFKLKVTARIMKVIKGLHEKYDVPFLTGEV